MTGSRSNGPAPDNMRPPIPPAPPPPSMGYIPNDAIIVAQMAVVLELLKAIREDLADVREDLHEIRMHGG